MNCVLLGTSTLAIPTAEALLKLFPPFPMGGGARGGGLVGIITKPTEPAGRKHAPTPPPVAVWAAEHGVPLHQPSTKSELTTTLRALQPDAAIVIAYGQMIPGDALTIPRFGFVNIHPSLLPKYRGPSPVQAAIANGDSETGVTLILLDAQMDHGPILAQERMSISPTATRSQLDRELAELGARLLERTLPNYLAGTVAPRPQDDSTATTTPLLSRDHGRIDWHDSAAAIARKVRAYEDWPGTWAMFPSPSHSPSEDGEKVVVGRRLKILAAAVGGTTSESSGTIALSPDNLNVACGDGRLLTLLTVQPEGKPAMDGKAFRIGHQSIKVLA
ncbi:MAG: methionyl-tRNA formyltransferase [bacterium]|nr:methionyl-tRNA formyltransferase [bacterium]